MELKSVLGGFSALMLFVGQLAGTQTVWAQTRAGQTTLKQAVIEKIDQMPAVPAEFKLIDWSGRGRKLDQFLFDHTATDGSKNTIHSVRGDRDFATIYKDATYGGYMVPAFYGEDRPLNNANNQESIVVTSALIAASLLGIDKNVPIPEAVCGDGADTYLRQLLGTEGELTYLDSALKFYWEKDGANVFTNVPNGSDSLLQNKPGVYQAFGDYWYMLIANQNFFRLAALNPGWRTEKIKEIQQKVAEKMCDMVDALGGENCDFDIQGFDMVNMKSVGTQWRQPDAAAGTANILYYAYKIFGTEKYLQYAKYCMDYLEKLNINPYYENMLIDAPYVAAMMNAEAGTDYDVSRYLNWITEASSSVRGGWGGVNYSRDGKDITGLTGNGGSGYAFFFNSVYPMTSILPTAKYDPSYARMAGKWALNIAANCRYFLPDELEAGHQTDAKYKDAPEGSVLAYEGFKKGSDGSDVGVESGTAMVGTGDAKANRTTGWKAGAEATNLGLYGSMYTGILGSLIEKTNVENILRLDCNKTDYYQTAMYPTYLYYNPNAEAKTVDIDLEGPCDLFDSVTGTYLAKNVSGKQEIRILADSARVIVLAPANSTAVVEGDTTRIGGKLVFRSRAERMQNAGTAAVASVTVTGPDAITQKGQTAEYRATVEPADAEDSRVVWSVTDIDGSKTDKARIDAYGRLTAAKNGQVRITAKAMDGSGVSGTKTVEIGGQTLSSLSFGKETKTSSTHDGFGGNLAVDGDTQTRWIAEESENNPWISVDLGASANITSVVLNWENARPHKYDIQISGDGNSWNTVKTIEEPGNTARIVTVPLENTQARYLRVYTQQKSQWGASMYELDVYGNYQIAREVISITVTSDDPDNRIRTKNRALQMYAGVQPEDATDRRVEWYVYEPDGTETRKAEITAAGKLIPYENGTVKVVAKAVDGSRVTGEAEVTILNQELENLALNKPVDVSHQESGNPGKDVNDGNGNTRWAAGEKSPNEWITIDLGSVFNVNAVVLNWEAAYGKRYKIQGSLDNQEFSDIIEENDGQGGIDEHTFPARSLRYIRMQGVELGTKYGYSLWEFEVYGKPVDRSGLQKEIEAAKEKNAEDYTETTWQNLETAVEAAENLMRKQDAAQEEIDAMIRRLQGAAAALEKKPGEPGKPGQADKSKLNQVIAKAGGIAGKDYTAVSYRNLTDALTAARALAAKEGASQDEVDAMTERLETAINSLKKTDAEVPPDDNPSDDNPSGNNPSDDNPSDDNPSGDNPSDDTPSDNHPSDNNPIVKKISKAVLSKTSCTYNGKQQKPGVTVYDGKTKLKANKDYTLSYKNNKKVGTASVTVKGKGAYTGTITKTFKIVPQKTAISGKIAAKSKGFTVKWKKTGSVTGYQVQYSTSKKFTKKTTVTKSVKKASTIKWTAKKLKAKKVYHVRVRAYQKVKGKTYYAGWSKVKTVRTKK